MKFSTCEAATYHPLIHETLLHAHDTIQLSYNFLPARKKYLYVIPPPPPAGGASGQLHAASNGEETIRFTEGSTL